MSRAVIFSMKRFFLNKRIAMVLIVCSILQLSIPQSVFASEKVIGATRREVCEYFESVIDYNVFLEIEKMIFEEDNEAVVWLRRYGLFEPEELVSRQEAFTIIDCYARALGLSTWSLKYDFSDYGEISSWARDSVDRLLTSGIVQGTGSGIIDVHSPITIHQLSLMVERVKELSKQKKLLKNEVIKNIKLAEEQLQPGTKLAVSYVDANTGAIVNNNAADLFHPASVIKDFYLYLFLDQVAKGEKSLEGTRLFIEKDKFGSPSIRVGGTGVMQSRPVNVNYKWRDLLSLMIINSDNVATNMVMKELGIDYINKRAKELGFSSIDVQGVLYQEPTAKTRVGVADMTKVLYLIDCLPRAEREFALKLMEMSTDKNRIARHLKRNFWVGNKSGSIRATIGDTAIIRKLDTNNTVYLTTFIYHSLEKNVTVNRAENVIADLSKRIMDLYQ